jgi:DNA-binding MarR family transcriptional regulator
MKEMSDTSSVRGFAVRLTALMPRVLRAMMRRERSAVARGDITLPQYWMLELLQERGPLTMTVIARALGLSAPSATALANRMVAAGYVRRAADAADRRRVRLSLAPGGHRLLGEVLRERTREVTRTFAVISAARRMQYLSVIEELVARADSDAAGGGAP